MSKQYPGGIISKTAPTPSGPYTYDTASGIWTLDQQAYWQKLGQWPTAGNYPKDAQFNYVTMLLHGDGTNGAQNNTFLDSSSNNFTITRNGNTTQGSFSPYGSNWSNAFNIDSYSNYFVVASNAAFGMGTGDFTLECWAYSVASAITSQPIFDCKNSSPVTGQFLFSSYVGAGAIFSIQGTGTILTGTTTLAANTWYHLAVVKSSGVYKLYVNGVAEATASNSVSIPTSGVNLGYNAQNGQSFNGYISNARIVKGTAVYTGNFTPSTTPLTAISGTSLLTCQSNRYVDNSGNNFTLTVTKSGTTNDTLSVQRFNPFGTSTAYSTSVIGGSGYFDGSGDYLTASSTNIANFGTGDFIVSAWFNCSTTSSTNKIFDNYNGNNNPNPTLLLNLDGAGKVSWYAGQTSVIASSSTFTPNTWNYVVVSRVSSTTKMFLNGTQVGSVSDTRTYAAGNANIGVGGEPYSSGGAPFNGYITDLQVVKGSGVTSSTVPTAPVSASGTTLALSFQNGAIYDNAMMNDLETVGNAQISTSVKKYGTGSLAFDGTGDYLTLTNLNAFTLTTGNWTIEGWVNPTTISGSAASNTIFANGYPVQVYVQNSNVAMYVSSTNTTGTYFVNPALGPTSSLSTGVWSHFACVKNGNNYTVYVNGVAGTTVTSSTAPAVPNTTTAMNVGSWNNTNAYYTGYIDDLRITAGYARYTANFTPPTAAFPDIGPN